MRDICIIGAGLSGIMLYNSIEKNNMLGNILCYLDDDRDKIGKTLNDIKILGDIDTVIKSKELKLDTTFIIAIPSNIKRTKQIYSLLIQNQYKDIKLIPSINSLFDNVSFSNVRDFKFEDMLIRDNIDIKLTDFINYLEDKSVLITGAGGSIGSEISRQVLNANVKKMYLLGHGENSIYQIEKEILQIIKERNIKVEIIPIIADVTDKDFLNYFFENNDIDIVFHAAAYKHVPMMEKNPFAVITNNVFGTKYLIEACKNVSKFVLISTDKAVRPLSIYGASKNLTEKLILSHSNESGKFMIVRFGNVMGSRGSVLPLFKYQIENRLPITITHKDMKRYFITIPEAVSLVLKTGSLEHNKKAYLLDMGEPILIEDIAKNMIRHYGYEPNKDIKLEYIGLREAEKIYEELYDNDKEKLIPSPYTKINELVYNNFPTKDYMDKILDKLYEVCYLTEKKDFYRNRGKLIEILSEYYEIK